MHRTHRHTHFIYDSKDFTQNPTAKSQLSALQALGFRENVPKCIKCIPTAKKPCGSKEPKVGPACFYTLDPNTGIAFLDTGRPREMRATGSAEAQQLSILI